MTDFRVNTLQHYLISTQFSVEDNVVPILQMASNKLSHRPEFTCGGRKEQTVGQEFRLWHQRGLYSNV